MAKLFLVRHGKSEWNKLGLWTGWTDVDLAEEGHEEARRAGQALKDEEIHVVHTSALKRTHQTFEKIKEASGQLHLTHTPHQALNERHYGIHAGKNKWQLKEELGEEEFNRIRRGWDVPIPEGETLKDVHARVVSHYEQNIKPHLLDGKNVLIVSHGNSSRALIKHLEQIADDEISNVELATGEILAYHFDDKGEIVLKETKGKS
jgi:2,3-bisphosphoglycerate-dependent phosphoglycerate mutase